MYKTKNTGYVSVLSAVLFLMVLISSCKEFIEPSIEDKKMVLLAPSDGTETKDYAQTFWWEEVEDALSYRLQVVSPDFNHTVKLVLDTLLKTNKFNYTLDPGNYEWRVRAENGSSATIYKAAAFTIYPGTITTQEVQLQTPANNTLTSEGNALFSWLKLFGADKYQLQIDTNNFADETALFFDQTTANLEYPVAFTREKLYKWRVKALNDTAESKWSVVQNITFDKTPPPKVTLASPVSSTTVASPVTLTWNASSGAKKYMLYVYKSDSSSPYDPSFPLTTTSLSYVFKSAIRGEQIFWEVRAMDDAGNLSASGEVRSFTIQ